MRRRFAALAVALVLAIVGTSAVAAYVNHADARAVAGVQSVHAYVAEQAITAGTSLKQAVDQGLAAATTLPRKTVPTGAVTRVTPNLASRVATNDIAAGTLLLTAAFSSQRAVTGGLSIPTGKLAVSVALEDPQRVGGFVKPGSDIAIFDTYNTVVGLTDQGRFGPGNRGTVAGDGLADGHNTNRSTRLLLPRVSVIAVGATVAAPRNLHKSADADNGQQPQESQVVTVTVAVDQHDAEKLIQAVQTGHLYLGLLTDESRVSPGVGVDDTTLFQH